MSLRRSARNLSKSTAFKEVQNSILASRIEDTDATTTKKQRRSTAMTEVVKPLNRLSTTTSGCSSALEDGMKKKGYSYIIGVDEAGRGPLAGPVVAAACSLGPAAMDIDGIDDSKKISAEQRNDLYRRLTTHPDVHWAAHVVEVDVIDQINILNATLLAMQGAADQLVQKLEYNENMYYLIDGNRLPPAMENGIHARAIIGGDGRCRCIAAASIVAKVTRDRIMESLHLEYPEYNFQKHKGYGVAAHIDAIKQLGPCPAHRKSFAPVKHMLAGSQLKGEASRR